MLTQVIVFILIGIFSGFLAGLLGIGGGIIIVPSLFFFMKSLDFHPEFTMYFATSTALASMVLTTLTSFLLHLRKNGIEWPLIKRMLIALIAGVSLGVYLGQFIYGSFLQILFSAFLIANGTQLLLAFLPQKSLSHNPYHLPSYLNASLVSLCIGLISVILGVAGGVFVAQYFIFLNVTVRKAISTASASSFIICFAASLFYIVFGGEFIDANTYGRLFFGPIYLPAFGIISFFSMCAAPLGVTLIYSLDVKKAKKIFGGFCILVGISMLLKTLF